MYVNTQRALGLHSFERRTCLGHECQDRYSLFHGMQCIFKYTKGPWFSLSFEGSGAAAPAAE